MKQHLRMSHKVFVVALLSLVALAALLLSPAAAWGEGKPLPGDPERGRYLTEILGCGGCHTEGALLGAPTGPWLAGSKIGVAYEENEEGQPTAVVFPANLTSDKATGLGRWREQDIVHLLQTGRKHNGQTANPVMPWMNYSLLLPQDMADIAAYLHNLAPVKRRIPAAIAPGQPIREPYVRIGVYMFTPIPDE